MKTAVCCLIALVLSLLIIGCGGGAVSGDATHDSALIGTWQATSASVDGSFATLATAMGWGVGVVRTTIEFQADGTLVSKDYTDDTTFTSNTGTWTTQDGTATVQFGSDPPQSMTYSVDGNVLTSTQVAGGVTTVVVWVKVTTLTGRDSSLLKTWSITEIKVDNVSEDIADFFGATDGDGMTFQFESNGSLVARTVIPPKYDIDGRQVGTWATGGNTMEVIMGEGDSRGYYSAGKFTYANEIGETVEMTMIAWGAAGSHNSALVGTWTGASATVNDTPVLLSTLFEWEPGTTSMVVEFWADGTVESRNYAGASVVDSQLGTWYTSGSTLYLTLGNAMTMTYSVSSGHFTGTMSSGGDTTVLVFDAAN
ncbi:MAG: lipocalin family protein [Armatimonadota bacterium]